MFKIIKRTKTGVLFHVAPKFEGGWITKTVFDNDGFFSDGILVFGGIERWSVILEEENKTSLLSQLDDIGVVEVNKLGAIKFTREIVGLQNSGIACGLTAKQFNILRTAVESGFFDCSRKIDSRQLAKKLGMAQSTLLEHLRKSQMKILSQVLGSGSLE
jgi:predicted DNA binding protein